MSRPAHGTECKQPQTNQPAHVITDPRGSHFMEFGTGFDIGAGGCRRLLEEPNLSTLSQMSAAGTSLIASTDERRCAPFKKTPYGTASE